MQNKKKKNNKADRAKLFQPFDSLKGFNKYIKEKVIIEKKELSTDDCDELNWKINQIKPGMMIEIVYFDINKYVRLEGLVSKIDLDKKTLTVVNKTISLIDIVKICSKSFD